MPGKFEDIPSQKLSDEVQGRHADVDVATMTFESNLYCFKIHLIRCFQRTKCNIFQDKGLINDL